MSDPVTIRSVQAIDAVALRENCFSMNTLEQVRSMVEENIQRLARQEGVQLVAEIGGLVVGVVSLLRQAHPLQRHRAEVAGLVVHPDYQGRGIARQLVLACRQHAAGLGVAILEISCRGGEPAEKVYPRLGFTRLGCLPGGLLEPWGERKVFDQVYFYLVI